MFGAFIADAAALGFHWLYDPDRIAECAGGDPAFREPDAADFDGYKGVFVHGRKSAGDLSQYGAQLRLAVQSMAASEGIFDVAEFQDRFAAYFDAGGDWCGYIDKATRGTLQNLRAEMRTPSGVEDDQLPAVARLPAVMANDAILGGDIDAAISVTSTGSTAATWGPVAASLLRAAYGGASPKQAAGDVVSRLPRDIAEALHFETDETDTVVFAGQVGRACPLPQAIPVIFHICRHARTYPEAVTRNILAGGDSCGRALILGAVFGAAYGFQGCGIPASWLARLNHGAAMACEIDTMLEHFT